jgi:hypothetical protein
VLNIREIDVTYLGRHSGVVDVAPLKKHLTAKRKVHNLSYPHIPASLFPHGYSVAV